MEQDVSGDTTARREARRNDPADRFEAVDFTEEANRLSPAELDERLKRLGELEVPEEHRSFWDGVRPQ